MDQAGGSGGGAADEHVVKNLPVPSGYSGLLSALGPGQFLIGPNPGIGTGLSVIVNLNHAYPGLGPIRNYLVVARVL